MVGGIPNEGYGEDSQCLGQFVDTFTDLNNVSVNIDVVQNSTYNAMELNWTSSLISLCQNFSTYIHIDPDNKVTPDGYNISWINYERNDAGRTIRDFGVNAIENFNWYFEFSLSNLDAGDADQRGIIHVLVMDQVNAVGWAPDHYTLIQIVQVGSDDSIYLWWMTTKDGTSNTQFGTVQMNVGTVYYINFFRNGVNKTLNIYTDAGMTNLVEHLSHHKAINDYRYVQVIKNIANANDGFDDSDGYMFELYNSTKYLGGYIANGYFTTIDYMSDKYANGTALTLMTNTSLPALTSMTVQFSENNSTWVNKNGGAGGTTIDAGFESYDIRDLGYSVVYVMYNFSTTDDSVTPRLYQSRLITTIGNITSIVVFTHRHTEYNASSIDVIIGTLNDGNLTSTYFIDNYWYNVSEDNAEPALDIRFNFTDIIENITCGCIEIYHLYSGHSQHEISVQVWNFTSLSWLTIGNVLFNDTAGWVCIGMGTHHDDYVHDGNIFGRLYHGARGHPAHELHINRILLNLVYGDECLPITGGLKIYPLFLYIIISIIVIVGVASWKR